MDSEFLIIARDFVELPAKHNTHIASLADATMCVGSRAEQSVRLLVGAGLQFERWNWQLLQDIRAQFKCPSLIGNVLKWGSMIARSVKHYKPFSRHDRQPAAPVWALKT